MPKNKKCQSVFSHTPTFIVEPYFIRRFLFFLSFFDFLRLLRPEKNAKKIFNKNFFNNYASF